MNQEAAKDFGPIQSDYAFFMQNSNEQERDVEAFAAVLGGIACEPVRVLDFGCGPGGFTERLVKRLGWTGDRCELSLVEPVADYRAEALARLQPMISRPIAAHSAIPDRDFGPFDTIVSNHVLYYVTDLEATLARLCALRAPTGVFAAALAGNDNDLIQMWHDGFALLGQRMPYNVADDVIALLGHIGIPHETRVVPYDLEFEDNRENRMKIVRFLFAQHLKVLPIDSLAALFDPFAQNGRIVIRTVDTHVAVRRT
jgi:trans-aconitate 2-methyltransferase